MTARKKKHDPSCNGTGTALEEPPPETTDAPATASSTVPPPTDVPENAPLPQPVKSFSVAGGGTTRVEGCLWPREILVEGKSVTAYSATIRKTYCGEDGVSRHSTSFRGAEIPLVQYVLERCAAWMHDQRCVEEPAF